MEQKLPSLSAAIVRRPSVGNGAIEKGVLVVNECDRLCRIIPSLKGYFYLVERMGWHHVSSQATADVKLVDNLGTLAETRSRFPRAVCLAYANADFVDTDAFRPLGARKEFTGIQISAWLAFKRPALLVRAAALLPDRRFIQFGHFWPEKDSRMVGGEKGMRIFQETMELSRRLGGDVHHPFSEAASREGMPNRPEEINAIINSARMGILTTMGEGVNRFKMECLAADIPVLVPDDAAETTKKHIAPETGMLFEPTPEGLARAILRVEKDRAQFAPRNYLLAHSGKRRALAALKEALRALARRDGSDQDFEGIHWNGRNESLEWDEDELVRKIKESIARTGR